MNRKLLKLLWTVTLLALAVSPLGCAPDFDPGSEIQSLRVLAVQKDKPYARPDDDVRLKMLWDDGSGKPARKIQIAWLAGCYNPRGDIFSLCFSDSNLQSPDLNSADAGAAAETGVSSETSTADADLVDAGQSEDGGAASNAPQLSIPSAGISYGDPDFPIRVGYGEDFTLHVPKKIISSRPPPEEDNVPRYGLAYVFFAVCAGEVRVVSGESFPLACYDGNKRLSSNDFVAGYTAVYAYAESAITNTNPKITGLLLDGKALNYDCIGSDCSGLIEPASSAVGSCEPSATVALCDDRTSCHKPTLRPIIDQSEPAEKDAVLSKIRGKDFSEQMWVNYYIDRGEVKSQVRLLNDAVLGWNKDYGTDLVATEPGTAYIWAVAHDNRGGTQWVRARVCVTP